MRRSVLFSAILLAALACLLPLALPLAAADACADCLCGGASDCCPPSCCPCCVQGAPVSAAAAWSGLRPVTADVAPSLREAVAPSSHPHDILHVPKS